MSPHTRPDGITRRDLLRASALATPALVADPWPPVVDAAPVSAGGANAAGSTGGAGSAAAQPTAACYPHPLLTPAEEFQDVSRGNPKPFSLKGDALVAARLKPESWRLEVVADPAADAVVKQPATVAKPLTLADGSALDLRALTDLGQRHGVRFLKAMQCLNIPTPLGQGLWEGVPLREVLRLCGKLSGVRRVCYWGFHNNDPKQMFRSSLSYTQVMETPPGELPAFVAYRLNGAPIPLVRGGPVRMVVPWAHGFKSIKWLQKIVLTNDYRANDTYAEANNDPESHLKTAAYLDDVPEKFAAGQPVFVSGLAISGLSGLKRVEYWLRRLEPGAGPLAEDDPAWEKAQWVECRLEDPPADWSAVLPPGVSARQVLGFDADTGRPASWPLRYGMASWSATIHGLAPGAYEVRTRAVDLNGYPQPEPRPLQKAGKNAIQVRRFMV